MRDVNEILTNVRINIGAKGVHRLGMQSIGPEWRQRGEIGDEGAFSYEFIYFERWIIYLSEACLQDKSNSLFWSF